MNTPKVCERCGKLAFEGEQVTVDAAEYAVLLRKAHVHDTTIAQRRAWRSLSRSRIALDPELAGFIVDNAETMFISDLVDACRREFPDRWTPSKSAIHRFLDAVGSS